MDLKETFQFNFKLLKKTKNFSSADIARKLGTTKSAISQWEHGVCLPSPRMLEKLCDIFSITPDMIYSPSFKILDGDIKKFESKGIKIPVLGSIPAGTPLEAIEDIVDYEEISRNLANTGQFFGLRVKGNSMSPIIQDGDTVIIKQQEDADSGKICVVMINGYDATLKEIKKDPNGIWILPKNPDSDFKPTFYTNQEIIDKPVRIIGVAIEIRRSL